MLTIIRDADNRAIAHGAACQITHTLLRTLAVEVATLQMGKVHTHSDGSADCRQGADSIIDMLGNVHRYITTVALGPAFLPEITGNLCHLHDLMLQGRAIFQY